MIIYWKQFLILFLSWLVDWLDFYGLSTVEGYLMPNRLYIRDFVSFFDNFLFYKSCSRSIVRFGLNG